MDTTLEALAEKLYPLDEHDGGFGYSHASDYQPIITHFGKPVVQVDDEDYQGDTRVLYDDDGKGFGYLNFGWGSCSGCDALQACSSFADVGKLIGELESSIKWLPAPEMLAFFKTHGWEGDYSWHDEEQKRFIGEVIAYLEPRVAAAGVDVGGNQK